MRDKKSKKLTIDILLLALFVLIILLSISAWWNATRINKKIEKSNKIVTAVNRNVISIDTLEISDSLVVISIVHDTLDLTSYPKMLKVFTDELIKEQRFILDANTISYLCQILAFFLIGLGIFLLNKGFKILRDSDNNLNKSKKKYKELSNSFTNLISYNKKVSILLRNCENIFAFSLPLEKEMIPSYNSKNLFLCHFIKERNKILQDFINKNQIVVIDKHNKVLIRGFLRDVVSRFETLGFPKKGHYNSIYYELNKSLNLIDSIQEENS